MPLIDEIKREQIAAGERTVMRHLEQQGLTPKADKATQYYTACFNVHDAEAFENLRQLLCDLMLPQGDVPYKVTAISHDHEMRRLDLIEQALEQVDDVFALRDIIDELLHMADIGHIKQLTDIEQFKDLEL